jgi:hypothetical protein
MNGFSPDSDWVCNIEAKSGEEVTIGSLHIVALSRFLSQDEATRVING